MKNFLLRTVPSLILVLVLTVPTVGCSKAVADDYGYERPKNAWLTECLLLPVAPIDTDSDE